MDNENTNPTDQPEQVPAEPTDGLAWTALARAFDEIEELKRRFAELERRGLANMLVRQSPPRFPRRP
jgi:hypothetical protein